MEDIRFLLTLAFSTSDYYMHFHLTLTDEELFHASHFSFLLGETDNNEGMRANTYITLVLALTISSTNVM